MKLVLLGGVQGVGKSILLSWLADQFAEKIRVLNPGEFFRHYYYNERIKTIEEIEDLIVSEIESIPPDTVAVLHWHYAVRRPEGYISQIDFSRLKNLVESGKIEHITLVSVEAPPEAILERRLKEQESKKRIFSPATILEEIAADERLLMMHRNLFSEVLGEPNVTVLHLHNIDLEETKKHLRDLFQSILQ